MHTTLRRLRRLLLVAVILFGIMAFAAAAPAHAATKPGSITAQGCNKTPCYFPGLDIPNGCSRGFGVCNTILAVVFPFDCSD